MRFLPGVLLGAVAGLAACGSDDLVPIRGAAAAPAMDGGTSSGAGPGNIVSTPATEGGTVDAPSCKRGIASNVTPGAAFVPRVSWWYDWSNDATSAPPSGLEFVPMIWGGGARANGPIAAGARHLLGFNEPNFKAQANLTPSQAASQWPALQALAKAQNLPIVSPAVNYCGSPQDGSGCSDPTVTSPYDWLKKFFADCKDCQVDAVAVHWYNCDLDSLKGYLEGNGGGLEGFVQFGKPIWLTEFACDGSHSVADQKAYMEAAIPYLEGSSQVARYSWFSAGPIPNAQLTTSDGTPTDLGKTYIALPQSCH